MARKNNKVDTAMVDAINEQNRAIADQLLTMIDGGNPRYVKGWNAPRFIAGYNQNAEHGTVYSGRNALITAYAAWECGYSDSRWLTANQIRKSGYVLYDDAEPVYIEKWRRVTGRKPVTTTDDDGNKVTTWHTFKYMQLCGGWAIYNVEEIIDYPAAENSTSGKAEIDLDADVLAIADRFIETSRCRISEKPQDSAYYMPSTDSIVIPTREQFKSAQGFLRTLLHEMGHSTNVPCKRRISGSYGDAEYAAEELVAELCSAFTAAAVLVDMENGGEYLGEYGEQHAAYLKGWAQTTDADERRKKVFKAAVDACKASAYLVDAYNGIEHLDKAA